MILEIKWQVKFKDSLYEINVRYTRNLVWINNDGLEVGDFTLAMDL